MILQQIELILLQVYLQLCDLKCLKVLLVMIFKDHCIISTYSCYSVVHSLGEWLKVILPCENLFE